MKRTLLQTIAFALALALITGCSSGIGIEHRNNNETVVRLASDKRYLLLPVEDGAPNALLTLTAGGQPVGTFRAALARTRTDCFVPLELGGNATDELALEVDGCPFDAVCWDRMRLSDRFRPAVEQRFRPLCHHTPAYGWMNDPNGMVWLDGEYHLFFQHNPYGSRWENMSWGHSISRDLVHWEQLPVVLTPDSLGAIFSGCCVIDRDNTAGFGPGAMIALYTAAGARQTQCLAVSTDGGRTFAKYSGNPVLTSPQPDFRDPKVFWHAPSGQWVMAIAAGQAMEFYSSPDLKTWRFESRFGEGWGAHTNTWECPDLIELCVDDDPQRTRWVLLCSLGTESGSKVQYFVGDFDGRVFTPDGDPDRVRWMDHGRDHYATVTWSNQPDGRCIALGWMNNWMYANDLPHVAFRGANTLPRELALRTFDGEPTLYTTPCAELRELTGVTRRVEPGWVSTEYNLAPLTRDNGGICRITLDVSTDTADIFGIRLFNCRGESVDLCLNRIDNTLCLDRTKSGLTGFSPAFSDVPPAHIKLRDDCRIELWLDRTSLEVFLDDGRVAMTNQLFPTEPYDRLNLYVKGGQAYVKSLEVSDLKL